MVYYCSDFAPFTLVDANNILKLQKMYGAITLLFVSDTMPAVQTRIYFRKIMEQLHADFAYEQVVVADILNKKEDSSYFFSGTLSGLLEIHTQQTIYVKEEEGYENKVFSEHFIFDDISLEIAQYIFKNELFGVTRQMGIVFNQLSYKRFKHSMRVAYTIKILAQKHGIDPSIAYFTALFHDYAKELPDEQLQIIMEKYYPLYVDAPNAVWHGFAGALLLSQTFDTVDGDILEAITYHPIGIPQLSELGIALYIADFCEFGRPFKEDANRVWKIAQTDLYAAALEKIKITKIYLEKNKKKLYWTTDNMLSWLEERVDSHE
ncbi:hypothetical protein AwErysi_01340 [Erysipelotrichaceae bacterium]|nr:hypothetical protein AwErysi_01340 [Erysipelotrichaceae bacterium]